MGQIEALVLAVVGGDDHFAGLDLVHHRVDLLGHIGGHLVAEGSHADNAVMQAGEGLAAVVAGLDEVDLGGDHAGDIYHHGGQAQAVGTPGRTGR